LHELEAALKSGSAVTGPLFGEYVSSIRSALERQRPDFSSSDEYDEAIVGQIEKGTDAVLQFAEAADLAARYGSLPAVLALYRSFGILWQLCELPEGFAGSYRETDFDGFKFLIYEMLVVLVAGLIRADRWDLLAQVLAEDIFVEGRRNSEYVRYPQLRLIAGSLDRVRKQRLKLPRVSVTSDLVGARITTGPLAKALSARAFMDADYLLYLRSALLEEDEDAAHGISLYNVWIPRSSPFMHHTPAYLKRAQSHRFLSLLSEACGVTEQVFKQRIGGRLNQWVKFFAGGWGPDGITDFDPAELGTRP
jgi:hypothetical protein